MRTNKPKVFATLLCCLSIAGAQASHACTMPGQLVVSQTLLNVTHPNATFVIGATWTLQKAGKLEMPDPKRITARGEERAELDETARRAALSSVLVLKNALLQHSKYEHSISIVLVELMHRERLMPPEMFSLDPLAPATDDDLLIVTTEPALHAITNGRMTIESAISFGVVRLYGTESQTAAFAADFSRIGAQPLAKSATGASLEKEGG